MCVRRLDLTLNFVPRQVSSGDSSVFDAGTASDVRDDLFHCLLLSIRPVAVDSTIFIAEFWILMASWANPNWRHRDMNIARNCESNRFTALHQILPPPCAVFMPAILRQSRHLTAVVGWISAAHPPKNLATIPSLRHLFSLAVKYGWRQGRGGGCAALIHPTTSCWPCSANLVPLISSFDSRRRRWAYSISA